METLKELLRFFHGFRILGVLDELWLLLLLSLLLLLQNSLRGSILCSHRRDEEQLRSRSRAVASTGRSGLFLGNEVLGRGGGLGQGRWTALVCVIVAFAFPSFMEN